MARIEYSHEYVALEDWIDGLPTRIAVRQQIEAGKAVRVCIGFQVISGNRWVDIVRYDDAHGSFHRHAPGVPPNPKRREQIAIEAGSEVDYATDDLRANGERYLREAMASGFEIPEDADDDEGTEDA
jgi:hypothetical protein